MAFANTMDRDLAAARAAMTNREAYRGTGASRPRRAPTYGGGQGRGGQGNIRRVSRQPGIAAANVRPRGGGIWNTAKAKASKFVHPGLEMMGKVGDLAKSAMRGSRLHQSYQDELGRVKGHEAWKDAKMKMMTDDDKDYYDKYMNLAAMAPDNEKKQYYLDQAETAWRNKQTSDRLSAITGFEDYDRSPDADKYFVEQTDYRGNPIPGMGRLKEVLQQWAPQEEGSIRTPHLDVLDETSIDITEDLYGGYPGPEDDVLWGEPGTQSIRPKIKPKPDRWRNVPEHGIPGRPDLSPPDPFGGMYESPLTDRLYGEPTNIGLASERALENRGYDISEDLFEGPWGDASSVALGKRGFANPGGTGYKGPLPNITVEFDDEVITPDYGNPDYFNQFIGRDFANPGGRANITEEEEQINPLWNQRAYKMRGFGG